MKSNTPIDSLQQEPSPAPRQPDAFWPDFKARVDLYPQQARVPDRPSPAMRWAWASACAILLLVVGILPLRRVLTADRSGTTIESYAVGVAHSAVLILNDESSDSTILWVVDMAPPANGGTT